MWLTPTLKFITWLLLAYLGVRNRHTAVEYTPKNLSFPFLNTKRIKNLHMNNLSYQKLSGLFYQKSGPRGSIIFP